MIRFIDVTNIYPEPDQQPVSGRCYYCGHQAGQPCRCMENDPPCGSHDRKVASLRQSGWQRLYNDVVRDGN